MANYRTPPGDGLQPLADEIADLRRQIRELQSPTATQIANFTPTAPITIAKEAKSVSFAIPGSVYNDVVGMSIPVPEGYSRAQVLALESIRGQNLINVATYPNDSYVFARLRINGVLSPVSGISAPTKNGDLANATCTYASVIEGLTGGSLLTISGATSGLTFGTTTSPDWNSGAANSAHLAVLVTFVR